MINSVQRCLRAVALAGSALGAIASSQAHAQAATPQEQAETASETTVANVTKTGTDTANTGIADIVVTAERRATNLQSTPLSIVAVTQDIVEAKGIKDLQDLSHFTPNLSISPSRGSGSSVANFVIRGVSGGAGVTGERGVGLYIDGIYMPRTSGAVLRVLDVDRIEVLRGPQGTLFGRNSTGGAIRIFSKQPSDTFEGSVEANLGNFDHHDFTGVLNVPLGNGFALRAQGAYLDENGFVKRGTQELGAEKDLIGRVQLRGDLTPSLKATVGFLYNRTRDNASPWVVKQFDMRPGIQGVLQGNYADWLNDAFKRAGQAPLAAYNDPRVVAGKYHAPDICLLDNYDPDYNSACNQYDHDTYYQADLRVDWKLGDKASLHSISGYSHLNHRAVTDWELIGMEARYDILHDRAFYQELQLNASLLNDAVDLVAGGSYFHENSAAPYNYILNRRGTSNYPLDPGTPPDADGGLYTRSISDIFQKSNSWGLFASATWHIVDGLNLTGGLRRAWDHKDYEQTRYPPPATRYQAPDFTVAPGTTATTVNAGQPFHALDYRATLDYHFTPDIMAYATVSKAYKAGSYSYTVVGWTPTNNATGPNQNPLVVPVPNEKVVNYEAGFRATLFDHHLRINPTGFLMHYTNRQAAVRVNCGTGPLANITPGSSACPVGFIPTLQDQGDAWIHGVEMDSQLRIGGGLTLDGNLGVTDYSLKHAPVGTTHLYPDIPKLSYTVGATYTRPVGFGRATLNVNYAYVGKQSVYPDDSADSGYILPAYGIVNARLQLTSSALPVTVSLYANNLLDSVYATYAQRFGGGFWDSGSGTGLAAPPRSALSVVRGRPREFGATVRYDF